MYMAGCMCGSLAALAVGALYVIASSSLGEPPEVQPIKWLKLCEWLSALERLLKTAVMSACLNLSSHMS